MFSASINSPQPSNSTEIPPSSQMEFKEDFGRVVRRIMYSNSGQFKALDSEQQQQQNIVPVVNREWLRYREMAEAAALRGNYSQAEAMWLAALSEAQNFNAKDPRIAFTLDQLASFFYVLGRYEQAEMFCKRGLEVTMSIYGGQHVRVADSLNNLAGIYYNQGRFAEAEPVCQRLLAIYEGVYGPDHADVGMAANNLAMVYHAQCKYRVAEELYQRALRIRAKALGKDHPCVITLLENYANLLGTICRDADAMRLSSCARGSSEHLPVLPSYRFAI